MQIVRRKRKGKSLLRMVNKKKRLLFACQHMTKNTDRSKVVMYRIPDNYPVSGGSGAFFSYLKLLGTEWIRWIRRRIF